MFGSPVAAISGIGGANVVDQNAVGAAADSLDRLNYSAYARARVSSFYLRNFPQFVRIVASTNDGRSYYDSFQLTLRRQAGALRFMANYAGDRRIGQVIRRGDGVCWLTAEEIGRFWAPSAGDTGTAGRNAFRSPRFNADISLVKKFKITERLAWTFRAEAYNLFNNANLGPPNASLATPASVGRISSTVGDPRILQMALPCDFWA